jgi:hypothetical protein
VFFDALDIRWQYETEGFILPCGYYLPDFWLPDQRLWLEIKGSEPTENELDRWFEFAEAADENWESMVEEDPSSMRTISPLPDEWRGRALLAFGDIPNPRTRGPGASESMYVLGDSYYEWTRCPICGAFGAEFNGLAARLCCKCPHHEDYYGGGDELILAAYAEARSARFEFDQRERWGGGDL